VPQQRHECLGPRVNTQVLSLKCETRAIAQQSSGRKFKQHWFTDEERQTGIATCHGMTDAVAFVSIKNQHLIRLSDGLVSPQVPNVDTAIRKYQLRARNGLLRTLVPAPALTVRVPNRNGGRFQ
jgi:hypothetical protein